MHICASGNLHIDGTNIDQCIVLAGIAEMSITIERLPIFVKQVMRRFACASPTCSSGSRHPLAGMAAEKGMRV